MAESSIKRVGVVVKPNQPEALATLCHLVVWLRDRGVTLVGGPGLDRSSIVASTGCSVETSTPESLAATVDLMVVLGGDGTMIMTSRMMGDYDVPVVGINYGTFGYLAEFRNDEMFPAFEKIFEGSYTVQPRVRLSVELHRGEELITRDR